MAPTKVFVVGVGPGSLDYLTDVARKALEKSDIVAGFQASLKTVSHLLATKNVRVILFRHQDDILKQIVEESDGKVVAFTCTGNPNFSDSEYIQRICKFFGKVEIIPGVSSIQVAASKFGFPMDKSAVFTFHVTGEIKERKGELVNCVSAKKPVMLLPRPWDFMPKDVARFLIEEGIGESTACGVCENLTLPNEKIFMGNLQELAAAEHFSDLSVMLLGESEFEVVR